jgi:hypothetical protein
MALLNNVVEFPSDVFKILTHFRHPLPKRTDTIGPWLDCLSFLAWLSALSNSALVYLFRPRALAAAGAATATATGGEPHHHAAGDTARAEMREVLARALFIALAASHGFILLRAAVRHVLERALWVGSPEKARLDAAAREVRERYLLQGAASADSSAGAGAGAAAAAATAAPLPPLFPAETETEVEVEVEEEGKQRQPALAPSSLEPPPGEFWQFDEGLDEIRKGIKET